MRISHISHGTHIVKLQRKHNLGCLCSPSNNREQRKIFWKLATWVKYRQPKSDEPTTQATSTFFAARQNAIRGVKKLHAFIPNGGGGLRTREQEVKQSFNLLVGYSGHVKVAWTRRRVTHARAKGFAALIRNLIEKVERWGNYTEREPESGRRWVWPK